MVDLHELTRRFAHDGTLEAIYLRPARGVAARRVDEAEAIAGRGLVGDRTGDRAATAADGGKRQVTLLQAEHVPLIAAWTHRGTIDPRLLRRNLVIAGLNLAAAHSPFADQALRVLVGDEVELVVTGDCAPCSKMETVLGPGGYNALRGHGGVTARVVVGGRLRIGDPVRVVDASDPSP